MLQREASSELQAGPLALGRDRSDERLDVEGAQRVDRRSRQRLGSRGRLRASGAGAAACAVARLHLQEGILGGPLQAIPQAQAQVRLRPGTPVKPSDGETSG